MDAKIKENYIFCSIPLEFCLNFCYSNDVYLCLWEEGVVYSMSEELIQRDLVAAPDRMGPWDYYNIGSTTLKAQ